jgi:nicotinate-nucleotide--dimethylbenzimidazole phosphoribosyltransferase
MNGVATTGAQDPAAKEVNTDSDGQSTGVTASGETATASAEDSASSPQATAQPAGSAETVSDELPRRRRGILLGTQAGPATPAAGDDAKSLSWMATQAVKAVNAVKASQMEQAQAWKTGAGMSEDEQSRLAQDDVAVLDAGEPVDLETSRPVQSSPGKPPATVEGLTPVDSSQEADTIPRIPPGAHRSAPPRVPARTALMLGVLVMFGYAGYRHWFAGDRTASEVPVTASAIVAPGGPADEVNMMTPPAISVVAAPGSVAGQSEPPAVGNGMALPSGPATDTQPATAMVPDEPAAASVISPEPAAGNTPPPAPANPASATMPEAWQPSANPAAPPPAAEAAAAASQPAPPSSPPPAVEANVPARQAVTPAPAARPRYPANGYGYYQPPSSWQPYYRPGYPQAPARQ